MRTRIFEALTRTSLISFLTKLSRLFPNQPISLQWFNLVDSEKCL